MLTLPLTSLAFVPRFSSLVLHYMALETISVRDWLSLEIGYRLPPKVLWSPRYFQRLWCSYEIATFLADGNDEKPLIFMPAHAGLILVLDYIRWSIVPNAIWLILHLIWTRGWRIVEDGPDVVLNGTLLAAAVVTALIACLSAPLFFLVISLAQNAQHARQQLRTFRMQDTLCFCCSNQHRHPDTGADIQCDRQLVYRKLKEWYGSPDDMENSEEYLSRFNSLVQTRLADSILWKMSMLVPRRYNFYMMAATNMPFFSETLGRILYRTMSGCSYRDGDTLHVLRWLMEWMILSLSLLFLAWWASFLQVHVGFLMFRYMPSLPRLCVFAVLLPLATFPLLVFLGSFYYLLFTDGGLLCGVPVIILLLVVMCCWKDLKLYKGKPKKPFVEAEGKAKGGEGGEGGEAGEAPGGFAPGEADVAACSSSPSSASCWST